MQTICPHLPQDPGLWHLAMPVLTSWPPFLLECRHPRSRLCPGDTWSSLLLSQTHFLPLRPTSHLPQCWDVSQGLCGTTGLFLPHSLGCRPWVQGWGRGWAKVRKPWSQPCCGACAASHSGRKLSLAGALWGLAAWSSGPESLPIKLRWVWLRTDQIVSRGQGNLERKSQLILLHCLGYRASVFCFQNSTFGSSQRAWPEKGGL